MDDLIQDIIDEQQQGEQQQPEGDFLGEVISDTGKVVEQPQNEPAEQSEQQSPEQPEKVEQPDFLSTHFPDFKSVDEVKEGLSAIDKYKEENETLRAEIEKIKGSLKGFDSGIDPNYLRLQKIEKEDPKLAQVYKQMMLGNLSSNELLKMSLIMEDSDLAEDKEMLEMRLEDKYPVLFDEDVDPDSDEYKKAMKKVAYDAKKAEQKIKAEFEKIDVPMPETSESRKQRVEGVLKTWEGFDFKNKDLTTVKVSLDGDNSQSSFMNIEIPEKERSSYLKEAMQYMVENGLERSKDSVKELQTYVAGLWIGRNLPKYNRMIADHRAQMSEREWRERIHNPKPQKTDVKQQQNEDFVEGFLNSLD
jgi:hypothetical protein